MNSSQHGSRRRAESDQGQAERTGVAEDHSEGGRARAGKSGEAQSRRRREPGDLLQRRSRPSDIEPPGGNSIEHLYGLHDLVHVDADGGAGDRHDLLRMQFARLRDANHDLSPVRETFGRVAKRVRETLHTLDHVACGLSVYVEQPCNTAEKGSHLVQRRATVGLWGRVHGRSKSDGHSTDRTMLPHANG